VVVKAEGNKHFKDLGIGGRVILKGISEKLGGKAWTGFMWFRIGDSGREGFWKHSNEHSGSINGREFLDYLSDYKLLKKDSNLWSQSV
jgi:hypothetical protein